MKLEQILDTYDEIYAKDYDSTFYEAEWAIESTKFQFAELDKLLKKTKKWLDVACGTGYVLNKFNNFRNKKGLELSPAMAQKARLRNPGVEILEGNFLEKRPELNGKWDLVTCMWWAYCLVETYAEMRQLVSNLSDWCSEGGTCFVPLCNVRKFDTNNIKIPYCDENVPGRIMITGITWTWIDENEKVHTDVLSPQIEYLKEMFEECFTKVEIVEGPMDKIGEGWRVQDILIAKK